MSVRSAITGIALAAFSLTGVGMALAQDSMEKAKAVKEEDGKWFDADGNPTFNITA